MKCLAVAILWLRLAVALSNGDSDSGLSLLRSSEMDDLDSNIAELRGLTDVVSGLGPWVAHLAVNEEYERLHLPLIACRSRFASSLRVAGQDAERAASDVVQAVRNVLDTVADGILAGLPSQPRDDPDIALIQASLNAGQRYPAGDVLESRWRRAMRLSSMGPPSEALAVWRKFHDAQPTLRLAIERTLRRGTASSSAAAKSILEKFGTCVEHHLHLRSQVKSS